MPHKPPYTQYKVRESVVRPGKYVVVKETRGQSGRILSQPLEKEIAERLRNKYRRERL